MAKYLFGGFKRCLYPVQKFQSDAERKLAVILEREALEVVQAGQGAVPDLLPNRARIIWNTSPTSSRRRPTAIYMLEPKARNEMTDARFWRKRTWQCGGASNASTMRRLGGKPWTYVLIPHDAIAENMTLSGLVVVA